MAWKQQKTHEPAEYRMLDLYKPGAGGLNIQDLDYTLKMSQSPNMLNMMYKNGVFGKRYGQAVVRSFSSAILGIGKYHDDLYLHIGQSIIRYNIETGTETSIYSNSKLDTAGIFMNFNQMLYFLNVKTFIQYDGLTCSEVEPYCPDVLINREPDGSHSDIIEDYNRLGAGFKNTFNADGTSTKYHLEIPKEDDSDTRGLDSTRVKAVVNNVSLSEGTDFTVNRNTGVVTFNSAPNEGQNNVVITAYKTFSTYRNTILNSKYWATFGGANNSRLFLAGNGTSTYYYSGVFDATYFPETNYAVVGNSEDDITGFGNQYNMLIIFKPSEIYSLKYSYETDSTGEKKAIFYSSQIGAEIGCDMPNTIKYIDNRLTWGNTEWGICTLCSTLLQDERNVRVISRNINGGYRAAGLLAENKLANAVAVNFEGKYIVSINGNAYAWDYTNAPFSDSDRISTEEAATALAWYKWDNFRIDAYKVVGQDIYYSRGADLCTFTHACDDFGKAISAVYRTPLLDFNAWHMLKTVKKVFFEVRGDTPSHITIKYITDENPDGDTDPEDIIIAGRLWNEFDWDTFGWGYVSFADTFARKCSIKKVTLFAIELTNDEVDRDMCFSGLRMEYTLIKEIK